MLRTSRRKLALFPNIGFVSLFLTKFDLRYDFLDQNWNASTISTKMIMFSSIGYVLLFSTKITLLPTSRQKFGKFTSIRIFRLSEPNLICIDHMDKSWVCVQVSGMLRLFWPKSICFDWLSQICQIWARSQWSVCVDFIDHDWYLTAIWTQFR